MSMNVLEGLDRREAVEVAAPESIRILRFSDVIKKTGLSKTAIYDRVRARSFPAPVDLGARAVGFVEAEVDCFLRGLVSARDRKDGKRA